MYYINGTQTICGRTKNMIHKTLYKLNIKGVSSGCYLLNKLPCNIQLGRCYLFSRLFSCKHQLHVFLVNDIVDVTYLVSGWHNNFYSNMSVKQNKLIRY